VDYLLLRTEWRHGDGPDPPSSALDPEILIEFASKLAFVMLGGQGDRDESTYGHAISREDIAIFVSTEIGSLIDESDAAEMQAATNAYLDRLVGRTTVGLLHERKAGTYEFAHRSFQEYLAARYLAKYVSHNDRREIALRPAWREVVILMASIAEATREGLIDLLMLVHALLQNARSLPTLPSAFDEINRVASGACLAAEMLAELGEPAARRYGLEAAVIGEPSHQADPSFSGLWLAAVETVFALANNHMVSRAIRLRALCVVSRIRDPRFVDRYGNVRPELSAIIPIPGGVGRVGTDEPLLMREAKQVPSSPSIEVHVSPFAISRSLITNLQYGEFILDGGYDEPSWWKEDEAERWRAGEPEFIATLVDLWESQKDLNFVKEFGESEFAAYAETASVRIAERTMARNLPLYWRDSRFNLPTAPVVGINLWEAKAYCSWLQTRWRKEGRIAEGDEVTLPSEIEWEWAAGRAWTGHRAAYPWGDEFDSNRCLIRDFSDVTNPRIVHFGGIPVGFFNLGTKGPELDDMAGNVWEWVTSLSVPWDDPGDRERRGGLDKRVVRGSSWFSREPMATHASFRLDDPPCNAYWDLGFRIVIRRPTQLDND
jgi:formylglycine-generating enzyme required for sulfatase activity